tara:strand:+ start:31336 stop:31809 length:474 start_codon:yes stop_codon:yes gene_type:complete
MSSLSVYTFSPEQVDLIISGYKVMGWNSIAVARNRAAFTQVEGIRDKNTRIRNKNSGATIFIDIARTSPVNTVFSKVVEQDLIHGTGRLEITIKDKSGLSLYSSIEAYIEKYPDDAITTELNNRRWSISCLSTSQWNVSGNEQAQQSLFQNITNIFE